MIAMKGPGRLRPDAELDTFFFERQLLGAGHTVIAGLDEVGRGPLAGPVVAACVALPDSCDYRQFVDSKKLTPAQRLRLHDRLVETGALIAVGLVSEQEIDRINILQASLLAMRQALEALSSTPDFILVDGLHPVPVTIPQQTLVRGESKSASIAAASIIAKVSRDRLMVEYDKQYPVYNFRKNKGYPTVEHRAMIRQHGPCPIHRRSFKGVREFFD